VRGSGRGLILRYYPHNCLEGLRKTKKNSAMVAGPRFKHGASQFEVGVLNTLPQIRCGICKGKNIYNNKCIVKYASMPVRYIK
jgi:hypothetical protein